MMVVNTGHRHILLGLFLVIVIPRSDAVIPQFWPQLGSMRSQNRAGSDPGSLEQCLLRPKETKLIS